MKQIFLKSFCARCLTLLVLALLSTNLAWGAEETVDIISELGLKASSTGFTNLKVNDYITISSTKGGASTATTLNYNSTYGVDLRLYKHTTGDAPTFTITASDATISKVEFKKNAATSSTLSSFSVNVGTLSDNIWTGSTSSVTFTYDNSSANFKEQIYIINVTYSYEGTAKTLTSIAISGTPTKTIYEAGESFDPAGLTVTGTFNTGDTQDLTEDAEWTINPATFTSTSQTSVSVTATVSGITSDAYVVNDLTVNEHIVTPGTYDIALNNTFWGTSYDGTATGSTSFSGTSNDIGITLNKNNSGSAMYVNNSQTRVYSGYTMELSVPQGYEMTAIAFTADGSNWGGTHTASVGTMTDTKNWSGSANSVTITFGGTCRCTKISVTYVAKKTLKGIEIKTAPKATYNAKETFDPTGMVITATYDDASTKDITYDANDDKWSFSPSLEIPLKGTDTKVDVKYGDKSAEQAITVNRLSAGLAVASETKDVVVGDMPNISEWYSVAEGYDGIVSVVSSNPDVFDVEETTGLAYAAGTATLTITASQTDYYAGDSKNIGVTVSTEAVHYTVTWINKGAEYTEGTPTVDVVAGEKVTVLPTAPTAIEGTAFMGWTAFETISEGQAPTDLFKTADDAPTVDANVVYRAVYAQEGEGEPVTAFTLSNAAPANGDNVLIVGKKDDKYYAFSATTSAATCNEITLTDNAVISNETINDYVWKASSETYSEKTGLGLTNSAGKLHFNSSAIKCATDFNNGIFEFSSNSDGFTMKGIVNKRWLTFNGTSFGVTDVETNASTIYIFKETELPGEKIHTNYSFTNVAPIKDVTVTPSVEEAETYWDAFTIALACETTDAEIRYTLDGSDPKESETVYSSAIEISGSNETITLRAIATDGNDNWSKEVTKEYTFGPIFSSLEDLAAADLESNTIVKVTFENVPIKSIFVTQQGYRNGIYFDIQKGGKDIEIYYQNVPEEWIVGGKVSGTMICPWKLYSGTWELAPENKTWSWSNLTYVAPTTVTIASSGYSSFSSTYAVTIPEGITAYYATGVEGNKVSMIEVEGGVIPANEGVIIKGEASQKYTFTETVSDKSFYNNKLVAVSERIEGLNPEVTIENVVYKNYVFTGGQFHPFTSGAIVSVGAGKAYLQIEKPSDTNAKLEMSFGDVTGIESHQSSTLNPQPSIYNLNGVRVSENYKGIIIVNGKKYMNK